MPMESDSSTAVVAEPGVVVSYSAAVELTWILMSVLGKHTSSDEAAVVALRAEHPDLVRRIESFWEDGAWWGELLVIADRTGTFLDADPERLFAKILEGVGEGSANLATESEADRAAVLARLERLAGDPRLRKRYVALLRELWTAAEGRFGDPGDADATVSAWRERPAGGASPLERFGDKHVARRPEWAQAVREATRAGTLVLSPVL